MNKDQAKKLYDFAQDFLIQILMEKRGASKADAAKILQDMINPKRSDLTPKNMSALWKRLLESVVNANMKSKVVGVHLDKICDIMCDYDPGEFQKKWGSNWQKDKADEFLGEVSKKLGKGQKIRKTQRSLWPQFFKSCVSSSSFLNQFENDKKFLKWADSLASDPDSNPGLPLILGAEIHGFGYALACDFLKEIGFFSYGKPDIHIKQIFKVAGLVPEKANGYQVQKAIGKFAAQVNVQAYCLDKLFWLIGSGKFYRNGELNIGNNKKEFCESLKSEGWTNLG